jgi:ABC-type transport system involved in multi-copper enzyme maturation permease subunit
MILKAIAFNTLREAVRSKILYLFFIFGILMIFGSRIISLLAIDNPVKIIKDFGLGSIHFFSILIVIILGIDLVSREIDKKTIYNILSKPVKRYQFLLGKLIGMMLTIIVVLITLFAIFIFLLWLRTGVLQINYIGFIYMTFLECLVLTSFALLFSSISSQLFSTLFTLGIFIAGNSTFALKMLKGFLNGEGIGAFLCDVLYYILPNLGNFNIKNDIVYNVHISFANYTEATLYAFLYAGLIFMLSVFAFKKRNFY